MTTARQERAARLRAEISDAAAVVQRLPAGDPVRDQYLADIAAKDAEARRLEAADTNGAWAVGGGLAVLGLITASTGLATGILLGGLLWGCAVYQVWVRTLDR